MNLRRGTEENHEYICCITEAISEIYVNCIFYKSLVGDRGGTVFKVVRYTS